LIVGSDLSLASSFIEGRRSYEKLQGVCRVFEQGTMWVVRRWYPSHDDMVSFLFEMGVIALCKHGSVN